MSANTDGYATAISQIALYASSGRSGGRWGGATPVPVEVAVAARRDNRARGDRGRVGAWAGGSGARNVEGFRVLSSESTPTQPSTPRRGVTVRIIRGLGRRGLARGYIWMFGRVWAGGRGGGLATERGDWGAGNYGRVAEMAVRCNTPIWEGLFINLAIGRAMRMGPHACPGAPVAENRGPPAAGWSLGGWERG